MSGGEYEISHANDVNPTKIVKQTPKSLLKFTKVSELKLCKIVNNMKPKKSCGLDGISNTLLKRIMPVIKTPLCHVVNQSLQSGIFPDFMKTAKVIPLYKAGDRILPDNYRPISLLPVLSKVIEKVVYDKIVTHLDKENLIYAKQFGFRKHHSTIDAVMTLTGEILNCFEDNLMMLGVFVDLRKAFDTVSYDVILNKLKSLGIEGNELEWCRDYLTNRRQVVYVNGNYSNPQPLTVGVQQGSLLGVLMFQIIINDLPRSLKFSASVLYADDTTLYVIGRNLRFLKTKMNEDLKSLSHWLSINNLKLNVAKTKTMLFNKDGLSPEIDLHIDGEPIETVTSFKFLGIILDHAVTFVDQYRMLYDRLIKSGFVIKTLCKSMPLGMMRELYFAY